jgi:hypothetical protein
VTAHRSAARITLGCVGVATKRKKISQSIHKLFIIYQTNKKLVIRIININSIIMTINVYNLNTMKIIPML